MRGDQAQLAGDLVAAFDERVAAAEFAPLASIYLNEGARPALWLGDVARLQQIIDRLAAEADSHEASAATNLVAARAGLAALEGRRHEALAGYRDAFRRYRDIGYEFDLARCVLDAVRSLGPDEPDLRPWAAEARAIFERVGAKPYLEWLDAALTAAPRGPAPSRAGRSVETPA